MNNHCPGCVQHGRIPDLKSISVKGGDCPGLDVGLEREKLLGTISDLQVEMNRIIRQKWDVEKELEQKGNMADLLTERNRLKLAVLDAIVRLTPLVADCAIVETQFDGVITLHRLVSSIQAKLTQTQRNTNAI